MEPAQSLLEGYIIEQTAKKMKHGFAKVLSAKKIGITVDQWIVLDILSKKESISQLSIAEKSGKDSPTITRILDILEKKEMLQRNADPSDRRRFLISLSPKGNTIIKKVRPLSVHYRTQCYKDLSSKKLDMLRETLNTISKNLEKL